MNSPDKEEILVEPLEKEVKKAGANDLNVEETLESNVQAKVNKDEFEFIYNQIEKAFQNNSSTKESASPISRKWLGPRLFATWIFPIFIIRKTIGFIKSNNFVNPYSGISYEVTGAETIYTSSRKSFQGLSQMRFMGPRFIAIWILPMAITGIVMELLFVSPLRNVNPFS